MKFIPHLLISISSAIVLGVPLSHARPPVAFSQPLEMARYVPPRPPSRGAPGTNRGAASRGCLMLAKITKDAVLDNLGALAPAYREQATTHVWARTTVEQPTIWFYNPYKPDSMGAIEFVLQDDQDNEIYRVPIALPQTVGLIGVQVQKNTSLQPGKLYHWYLNVRGKECTSGSVGSARASSPSIALPADSMTAMVYVDGWIERAALPSGLSDRLKQATPQQQAALYGEAGFWYDAIDTLAKAQLAAPNNAAIKTDWNALLQDGGLEKLSAQPLVNCCTTR